MKRTDITALFPDATDEQIKALMDINGADINKAKQGVTDLQNKLTQANATIEELQQGVAGLEEARRGLEEAQQKATQFETELTELRTANTLREVREKVSKATGVPASLLTGADEKECTAQANSIKEYARPSAYPQVTDGGEVGGITPPTARDQFAEWFNSQI